MVKKILLIERCVECSYASGFMDGLVCEHPDAPTDDDEWAMDVGKGNPIPDECPLEDSED